MTECLSRKDLFEGGWRSGSRPIRPPWTPAETEFTEICTSCGKCVSACPQGILVAARGGYPRVEFVRGACDFCGACADNCPENLFADRDTKPWNLKAHIGAECLSVGGVACRVCAEWCDARAIRFRLEIGGRAHPEIRIDACSGCGACVEVCPVNAISMEESA